VPHVSAHPLPDHERLPRLRVGVDRLREDPDDEPGVRQEELPDPPAAAVGHVQTALGPLDPVPLCGDGRVGRVVGEGKARGEERASEERPHEEGPRQEGGDGEGSDAHEGLRSGRDVSP
jgi:hypothetical protein